MSTAAPTDTPAIPDSEPAAAPQVSREEQLRARGKETDWLDVQWSLGKFGEYAFEYIITADHVILAHSRNLNDAYHEAERKADELGIPHWKLVNYYCDGY
jgi:hypothetical protein